MGRSGPCASSCFSNNGQNAKILVKIISMFRAPNLNAYNVGKIMAYPCKAIVARNPHDFFSTILYMYHNTEKSHRFKQCFLAE